jgi:hypothetical protein
MRDAERTWLRRFERVARKVHTAYVRYAARVVWRERGQSPGSSALAWMSRSSVKEYVAPGDVLVTVGAYARVPAVSGELVVGGGHEQFALGSVLADEDDVRSVAELGQCSELPPPVEKAS